MLKVGFLGGIAEFGNNCCFVEYKDEIIIIDVGFKFFTDNEMGVRYEIPDFYYLIKNKNKVKCIIITHGHLDHIGGLPYFLEHVNCNIYASPFTIHLIKNQLKNKNHIKNLNIIKDDIFNVGNFKIEPYWVNHSIIDSMGFIIHTPIKDNTKLIFCGDIKNDNNPFIGRTNNFSIFKKYKAPKILFIDSTNAPEKGHNISESQVYTEIKNIYKEYNSKNRIVFTTFSSQIERILQVIDVSIKFNRKIVVIGRSIFNNLKYILNLKEYKKYKNHIFFSEEELKNKEKITILATGSQGEENSAILKILNEKNKNFNINKKDIFIFSSSIIPGNEKKIYEVWNQIYLKGSEVISYKEKKIHASGHGKEDELKKIIKAINPDYLIPIHGEYRNLYNQKKIALECKLNTNNIYLPHKGDVIKITEDKNKKITLEHNLQVNNIILDQNDYVINYKTINERKKIIKNGVLVISIDKNNIKNIKIKGLGINNFGNNEENIMKKRVINNVSVKKNDIEKTINFFFQENKISFPLIIII